MDLATMMVRNEPRPYPQCKQNVNKIYSNFFLVRENYF